jgi:hypothetical protein
VACIREVFSSNQGQNTGYLNWNFRGFPQVLQPNVEIIHRLFDNHFLSNPFQYLIILPFDTIF